MDTTAKLILITIGTALAFKQIGPLALLIILPGCLYLSGFLGRNIVWDKEKIVIGSPIVSVEPKVYKLWVTHFEVTVRFADGSWCRKKIEGNTSTTKKWGTYHITYSYDEWQLREALEKAVEAHEQAAISRL